MTKRRDRMRLGMSLEHDCLFLATTFRGKTPCVTAATESMVEVSGEDRPTWVYLPLSAVVRELVDNHDNYTIPELRKIVNDAVRKGFLAGVADRQRSNRA
jgi:hypothetical protein